MGGVHFLGRGRPGVADPRMVKALLGRETLRGVYHQHLRDKIFRSLRYLIPIGRRESVLALANLKYDVRKMLMPGEGSRHKTSYSKG